MKTKLFGLTLLAAGIAALFGSASPPSGPGTCDCSACFPSQCDCTVPGQCGAVKVIPVSSPAECKDGACRVDPPKKSLLSFLVPPALRRQCTMNGCTIEPESKDWRLVNHGGKYWYYVSDKGEPDKWLVQNGTEWQEYAPLKVQPVSSTAPATTNTATNSANVNAGCSSCGGRVGLFGRRR